jgi:hypothetical protein
LIENRAAARAEVRRRRRQPREGPEKIETHCREMNFLRVN